MFTEKYLSRASRSNAGTKKESSEESTLVRGVIPLEMEGGDSKVVELKVHTFPAENEWYHSSLLLLADIVGSGILALSGAFSKMGWFFGFLLLILCCPLNMYTGILLARLRKHHPLVTTYGELGESLFGKKVGYACYAILYIYIFFLLGEYVVVVFERVECTRILPTLESSQQVHGCDVKIHTRSVLQNGYVSSGRGYSVLSHTFHLESGKDIA